MQPPWFSPDGHWWWDGWQWLPAYTPDRRWRFDGTRWVPVSTAHQPPPRWLLVSGSIWLAALAAWLLFGAWIAAATAPENPGRVATVSLVVLAGVAAWATCAWGFLVGRRRATRWLWAAAAFGTGVELSCYAVASLAVPDPDGTNDIAAGAGVVFLAVPTAVVILTLLWIGAGLGVLWRRFR